MAEFNINGFSFDLSELKNLSKEEIEQKDDKNLLSLFNLIDSNKDNTIDNEEISIFARQFQNADKNNDKTVNKKEFKDFIKGLKKIVNIDFDFDIESVTSLFNLSLSKADELSVLISENTAGQKTDDEIKDDTIAYLENEYKTGLAYLEGYDEGIIDKGYNAVKEFLHSKMAKSNFIKALYIKNENAELLKRAKEGTLTRKEYCQCLRDTLFEIFPGIETLSSEQKEKIRQHINTLDESRLIKYQLRILSLPNPNDEYYNDALRRFLDGFKADTTTINRTDTEFVQDNLSYRKTTETEALNGEYVTSSPEELITFEEVFKDQHGVEYDRQNMENLFDKRNNYLIEKHKNDRKNQIHGILDDAFTLNQGNASVGTSADLTSSSERLQSALMLALQELGAGDDEAKTKLLRQLTGDTTVEIIGGSLKRTAQNNFSTAITPYELNNLVSKLISYIDSNASDSDLKIKESEYIMAYGNTFGEQMTKAMTEAYVKDNEKFIKTTRTTVEIGGAAAMVIGLFTCPPLAIGGAAISSVGGVAFEMTNEVSKKHIDKEKIRELCKELAQNVTLFASGMGAGKAGMAAKSLLIAKKCPRLVACIADIGLDSTLSLLADLAITGQINVEGEGISQIVSLIAGHIKGGRIKLNNSIQDLAPGKNPTFNKALSSLAETDPKLYEDYVLLRSKNMLPKSDMGYDPKNASFTKEFLSDVKTMADAVRSGKNPIDAFIPKMKSVDEAIKIKNEGEVFSLEGTNDVYIKTNDGAVKLDMDRDMYYRLFPPMKSYATQQGSMGNCYFVSGFIDASMGNPAARIEFLKHFHQKGDDLVFDVGYYNHALDLVRKNYSDMSVLDNLPTEITFKNAVKRGSVVSHQGITGAEGLKIAEQAMGYKMVAQRMVYDMARNNCPKDKIDRYIQELTNLFNDQSYNPSKEFKEMLSSAYKMPKLILEAPPSNMKAWLMTKIDEIEAVRIRQEGRGGLAKQVLSSFYDLDETAIETFTKIEMAANSYKGNQNVIMVSATKGEASGILEQLKIMVSPKLREQNSYKLVNGHQFRIASVDANSKTVQIVNPWDCSRTVTLDFATFSKYFGDIEVIDITKTIASKRPYSLVKQMESFGMPLTAKNGRYYSTEELINNYIEKTGNTYNSYMHKSYWSIDDIVDEHKTLLDNPRVKAIIDDINKINNVSADDDALSNYLAPIAQAKNPAELTKLLDTMSNFVAKANSIENRFFNHVLDSKKSIDDYLFTMEHATEIITKMKQKNYLDSDIEHVLQLLSKDNYNSLKYLFE